MKKKLARGLFYLAIGFLALFGFRLIYGYFYPNGSAPIASDSSSIVFNEVASGAFAYSSPSDGFKKNYASEKIKIDKATDPAINVNQKYEKIASVQTQTRAFDNDEKKLRNLTAKYQALIQFEQNSGLIGSRQLVLAIGVPPENFDKMIEEVKNIGRLTSLRIDKTDKTNEYKDLNAKRISLEKTRDSLLNLKKVSGNIDERINLENRILEIETEIQSSGVRLGEYDAENEFCTVRLGLEERSLVEAGIPIFTRVKVALEWTIKYYLLFLTSLLVGVLLIWALTRLLERFKLISSVVEMARQA